MLRRIKYLVWHLDQSSASALLPRYYYEPCGFKPSTDFGTTNRQAGERQIVALYNTLRKQTVYLKNGQLPKAKAFGLVPGSTALTQDPRDCRVVWPTDKDPAERTWQRLQMQPTLNLLPTEISRLEPPRFSSQGTDNRLH